MKTILFWGSAIVFGLALGFLGNRLEDAHVRKLIKEELKAHDPSHR